MLNGYHRQFLATLANAHVRFLVIGGQARWLHFGTTTRDLDLWVHAAPANLEALSPCLIRWKQRYPSHTSLSLEQLRPLRRNLQIPLPDADVHYLREDGELERLSVDERIDVLTSVQAVPDAEFSNYYGRAATRWIDGFAVRIVAIEDLDVVSPPK